MTIHPLHPTRPFQKPHRENHSPESSRWRRFTSHARKLSFRYPGGWGIARQGSYIFLCDESQGSQLVFDLTPIHLYPYEDVSEYMNKMGSGAEVEIKSLPGGYQSSRVHKPAPSGKEFNLFYIGKGNMAYSLTTNCRDILDTAIQIIHSIRFE